MVYWYRNRPESTVRSECRGVLYMYMYVEVIFAVSEERTNYMPGTAPGPGTEQ